MDRSPVIACVRVVQRDPATPWGEILDALDAVSPVIEDGGDCAYGEMRGIAGDAARWRQTIEESLAPYALQLAIGIGPNRFVACIAALSGRSCVYGEEAGFVAPMPLDVLPIDPKICERLRLLGIRTLGELAALPHGPFVRRFGPESARWHALARGIDDAPLVPRTRRVSIERTLFGEGNAVSEEALLFALRTLVARIVDDLVALGKRAAELTLDLECEDGDVHQIRVRIAHPTARETMLFDLVRAHLEGIRLTAPVEGLRLRIERMESGGTPLGLFSLDDPDAEAIELALARLEAAFGEGKALRARVLKGYRPEQLVAYERFSASLRGELRSSVAGTVMQLRLFPPRAIDVITQDGVPRFVGTPPQAVADYAGPWRVAEAWWSDASLTRDDYDIMLDDGTLYRIARRDCENDARWLLLGVYD